MLQEEGVIETTTQENITILLRTCSQTSLHRHIPFNRHSKRLFANVSRRKLQTRTRREEIFNQDKRATAQLFVTKRKKRTHATALQRSTTARYFKVILQSRKSAESFERRTNNPAMTSVVDDLTKTEVLLAQQLASGEPSVRSKAMVRLKQVVQTTFRNRGAVFSSSLLSKSLLFPCRSRRGDVHAPVEGLILLHVDARQTAQSRGPSRPHMSADESSGRRTQGCAVPRDVLSNTRE